MRRWALPAALVAMALAAVAAIAMTPEPGFTPALGFAGWPRLFVYGLGGLIFGITAPVDCISRDFRARRVPKRAYVLIGLGLLASVVLGVIDVQRLRTNIADPIGPPLWIASMAVLVGYMLFPLARAIGWQPLWPQTTKVLRWRWLPWLILGGLVAASVAIRLPALATIPLGINPDEGDRTVTAFDVLNGTGPASWFDSGWFFINMLYFRTLALSLIIFGPTVAGGRMLAAIAGIAFVGVITWVGCRNFGWRVGLLATAFAAGMMMTVQHSRLITEAGITLLLWAISIGGFLEGARSGRLWAWAVAGVSGGLGLYYYPSARLWAVGAVLTVTALVVYLRSPRLFSGIAVAAVGSILAAAPFLVHLSTHTDEIAGRYAQTAVMDPHNQERLAYLKPPESPFNLFALQFERSIGMFDRYPDGGGFLPIGRPVFGPPLAQLTLIGAVYLLVRSVRDVRMAVLSVWFWLGLSGVALTVETPDYLRSVGMLPSLCFVLAIPLLDLVDRVVQLRPRADPVLAGAAPAAVAFILLAPEVVGYFTTFRTMPNSWGPETREGQLVAALGQRGPVYTLEMNEHMVTAGWVRLLSPGVERGRMPNPGRELPVVAPVGAAGSSGVRPDFFPTTGQGFSIIFSGDPNQQPYIPLLQHLYPQAVVANGGDGRTYLSVSPDGIDVSAGATLVDGSGLTHPVDTFGAIPADVALPSRLTWRAGIRLLQAGTYRVDVSAPAAVQLRLDGGPVASQFQAVGGLHFLEMETDVADRSAPITVKIQGAELGADQLYRLMDAPWGLLARVNRPAFDTQSIGPLDATVAMAFFDPELGFVTSPNSLVWSGSLIAPYSGTYRMAFASEDMMHLQIDGLPVDVVTVGPEGWQTVGTGSQVQLTQGAHRVQVTLDISHGGRELARWNWVPPTATGALDATSPWSVVPPWVLRPD